MIYRNSLSISLGLLVFLSACSLLPDNNHRVPSYQFNDTENTRLGQIVAESREDAGASDDQTGVYFLDSGLDAFVARIVSADLAEHSVDVQYYLYKQDFTSQILVQKLLLAAERGVRVRLLVDDMGLSGRGRAIAMLDSDPNFEIRIWNPFSRRTARAMQYITRFGSVTRRMHNKSFTVDNQLTIIGGRNIGDEYFDVGDVVFGDLDVVLVGEAVGEVSTSFDEYWNHPLAYPVSTLYPYEFTEEELLEQREALFTDDDPVARQKYAKALLYSNLTTDLILENAHFDWVDADILVDHPDKLLNERDKSHFDLFRELRPHLAGVEKELIIVSPYFVPTQAGVDSLVELAERGVRVRILTNSYASTDVWVVHSGYAPYRDQLLAGGVELHEMLPTSKGIQRGKIGYSRSSLHAKFFVMDRKKTFVGSFNFDPRSVAENTEIGTLIDDKAVSAELAEYIDEHLDARAFEVILNPEGEKRWTIATSVGPAKLDEEPYTNIFTRLKVKIGSWLPIESQL